LTTRPKPFTRLITPEHAKLVAGTGGVIGIWPPASRFPTMRDLARGFAAMVDVVGVDHVGLGSDMLGLTGPAIFRDYDDTPALSAALLAQGFSVADARKLLGGNYVRVFLSTLT
jgi:membrane dipeptidase